MVVFDMETLEDDDVENVAGGIQPDIILKCVKAMQAVFDICWKNDVCSISVN